MSTVDIKLARADRIYKQGDIVSGVVVISTHHSKMAYKEMSMKIEGSTKLQLSARSVGLFEAFYSSIKPMELLECTVPIAESGSVPAGLTEFPFEFPLVPLDGQRLYETYHGVYVNTAYSITVECSRGMLSSNLTKEIEFIVEVSTGEEFGRDAATFSITPESLENVRRSSVNNIPRFKITGKVHRTNCPITQPLTGEIMIEESEAAVKSIELQLVRVETVAYAEGQAREATEIQNMQVADGDVCRNLVIPLYMVFPRLFTCPTMLTSQFKVEFEINVIVLFKDGYMVTENFPLLVYR